MVFEKKSDFILFFIFCGIISSYVLRSYVHVFKLMVLLIFSRKVVV